MPTMPTPRRCNLQAALRRMGGSAPLLKQVIGFYHADAPGLQQRLRDALQSGDGEAMQLAAHSLKGLVSNFDAELAVKAALRVEHLGQTGELAAAALAIDELNRELEELSSSLDAEAASLE